MTEEPLTDEEKRYGWNSFARACREFGTGEAGWNTA